MPLTEPDAQSRLAAALSQAGAVAGTLHLAENGVLRLAASVNIPPHVRQAIEQVPSGTGMAGLALERGEPVQTCDLPQSGVKAVNANAAIALPVRDEAGAILAVVGMAFGESRQIEGAELERLQRAADSVTAQF